MHSIWSDVERRDKGGWTSHRSCLNTVSGYHCFFLFVSVSPKDFVNAPRMTPASIPELIWRNQSDVQDLDAVVFDDGETITRLTYRQLREASEKVSTFCGQCWLFWGEDNSPSENRSTESQRLLQQQRFPQLKAMTHTRRVATRGDVVFDKGQGTSLPPSPCTVQGGGW